MTDLLSDTDTYLKINKDPIRRITVGLRSLLSRWKSKKYIDEISYKKLLITDGLLPRAIGCQKYTRWGIH